MNFIDKIGLDIFFGSQSVILDHAALVFTNAWTWLPLYLMLFLLIIKKHDNSQQILICTGCCILAVLLATGLTTAVMKPLVERVRPCNDLSVKYLAQIPGDIHNKDYSFFSSHAATTMAVATFFAFTVRYWLLSVSLYIWSLVNCWTRLYLGQHYLTDILVGIVWGVICGSAAFYLYNKTCKRLCMTSNFISSQYTPTGFMRSDINLVLLVLYATYLVVLCTINLI